MKSGVKKVFVIFVSLSFYYNYVVDHFSVFMKLIL